MYLWILKIFGGVTKVYEYNNYEHNLPRIAPCVILAMSLIDTKLYSKADVEFALSMHSSTIVS